MLYSSFVLLVGVAASFQNVVEADEVGFNVGIGISDAVAYTCLCGKVDYDLGVKLGKEFVDELTVCYVAFDKAETGVLLELCQAFYFEADIVVVIHVVYSHYLGSVYLLIDSLNKVTTNEACYSCY